MRDKPTVTPGLVIGAVILAVGVIMFLDRQGIIDATVIWEFFWPGVFVAAGILKLAQSLERPAGRAWGAILIGIGILIALGKMGFLHLSGREIFPLVLILVGVILLWGAIEGRTGKHPALANPTLNKMAILGGGEIASDTQDFRGGELLAIFGGYSVDLREAGMQSNEAVLYVNAIFGGIDIKVPETWSVVVEGTPILGGFSEKTRHPKILDESQAKRLYIRGLAMFGGVEGKN